MHPKRFLTLVLVLLCALLVGACGSSAHSPKASIEPSVEGIPATAIATVCQVEPLPLDAKPCVLQSAVRPDGYTPASPPSSSKLGLIGSSIHIDTVGLRFIEGFEGFGSCPYFDSFGGVWTRGYGETEGISRGSKCISRAFGEANLKSRIERFYAWSIRGLGVSFNQYEADALYSFVWNLGAGIFTGSLRLSIQHHRFAAILAYDHAGGVVLAGLSRRRRAEYALALRKPPKPHRTLNQAYTRRRVLRRELLVRGCDRRRDHRQKLGPTCKRWFAEGSQVNSEIHSKGGR